jgi:hypothetical protein
MQKRKYIAEVNLQVIKEFLMNYWEQPSYNYGTQSAFYRAIEIVKWPYLCQKHVTLTGDIYTDTRRLLRSEQNKTKNVYAPANYYPIVDFLLRHGLFGYKMCTGSRTIQYVPTKDLERLITCKTKLQFESFIDDLICKERARRKRTVKEGYKGEIADFPREVVEMMLTRQFEQSGVRNVSVFERSATAGLSTKGFSWERTPEQGSFWSSVISDRNFDIFFQKYPKNKIKTDMKKETVTLSKDFVLNAYDAACPEWKIKIQKELPDLFNTYEVGDKFKRSTHTYILANVGYKTVAMINIESGNRWSDGIEVENIIRIGEKEFSRVINGATNFVKI